MAAAKKVFFLRFFLLIKNVIAPLNSAMTALTIEIAMK